MKAEHRRGFALLMTLALLALAAVVLLDVTRRSAGEAADALVVREQFAERWRRVGLVRALLPQAETLLETRSRQQGAMVVNASLDLELDGRAYRVTLGDEQAKLNLVTMLGEGESIETLAAGIAADLGLDEQPLEFRADLRASLPADRGAGSDTSAEERVMIWSWAQVFREAAPQRLYPVDPQATAPTASLTLFGDGRLNIARCSTKVLRSWLADEVTASQMEQLIGAWPDLQQSAASAVAALEPGSEAAEDVARAQVEALLESVGLPAAQRQAILNQATFYSRCWSAHIVRLDEAARQDRLTVRTVSLDRQGQPQAREETLLW
jgi:hypothetical protein